MSLPSRYFQPTLYASSLLLVSGIPGAHAIHRSIGALDPVIKEVVDTCFALPDLTYDGKIIGYAAGKCPSLINCIMDNLHGADQAGLSAGTSIACLLPTILALVGAGPIELVQLGFASPIRAVATCLFGIGLPSGLFRQLRTSVHGTEMQEHRNPCARQWHIFIPRHTTKGDIARRVFADMAIVGLSGVMLWRNWVVGSITMITFRCEYSWLLFCWPMACLVWLGFAAVSLYFMSREIKITFDGQHRPFLDIVLMPYRYRPDTLSEPDTLFASPLPIGDVPYLKKTGATQNAQDGSNSISEYQGQSSRRVGTTQTDNTPLHSPPLPGLKFREDTGVLPPTPRSAAGIVGKHFTVTITMRREAFWQWYEAAIETVAVGVYLYATIVLGSILFLTGQSSIEYVVTLVLSLAFIRILGNVL